MKLNKISSKIIVVGVLALLFVSSIEGQAKNNTSDVGIIFKNIEPTTSSSIEQLDSSSIIEEKTPSTMAMDAQKPITKPTQLVSQLLPQLSHKNSSDLLIASLLFLLTILIYFLKKESRKIKNEMS